MRRAAKANLGKDAVVLGPRRRTPACERGVSKGAPMPYSRARCGGVWVGKRGIDCLSHLKVSRLPELQVLGYEEVDSGASCSPTARALRGDHVHHARCALACLPSKSSPR